MFLSPYKTTINYYQINKFLVLSYVSISLLLDMTNSFKLGSYDLKYALYFFGIIIVFINMFCSNNYSIKYLTISLLLCVIYITSSLIMDRFSLGNIVVTFFSIFIAFNINKYNFNSKFFLALFLLICSVFATNLLFVDSNIFIYNRNSVSFILIISAVLYYYIEYIKSKKIKIIPSFICLVLCVVAQGRSGIIASSVLFIGCMFSSFKNLKSNIFLCLFFIFLLSFLFNLEFIFLIKDKYLNYFLSKGFNISHRAGILINYFSEIGFKGFLFGGPPISEISFLKDWNYNLHNSFLSFHYHFGIGGVFVLFSLIMLAVIKSFFYIPFISLLMLVLIIRISTDIGMFVSFTDFILYAPILFVVTNIKMLYLKNIIHTKGNNL